MNSVELVICVKVLHFVFYSWTRIQENLVLILVFHCDPEKFLYICLSFCHAAGDNYNDIDTVDKSVLDITLFHLIYNVQDIPTSLLICILQE